MNLIVMVKSKETPGKTFFILEEKHEVVNEVKWRQRYFGWTKVRFNILFIAV